MNRKVIKTSCGLTAVALVASIAVACGDDSSSVSAPQDDPISSAEVQPPSSATTTSSESSGPGSSETATSSESSGPASSETVSSSATAESSSSLVARCDAFMPECGYTEEELCAMGETQYCVSSSSAAETCLHITDETNELLKWKCDRPEFTVATDCAAGTTFMCAGNRWTRVDGCDLTKEKCGFDDYKLCAETGLKQFCLNDDWIDEPCNAEVEGQRFLNVYTNPEDPDDDSFSQKRYLCTDGKWVEYKSNGLCEAGMDCGVGKLEGTSCEKENKSIVDGGRAYMCLHGVWVYMPAPTGDGLPLCRYSDADRQTFVQNGNESSRMLACDDGLTCQERISRVDFTPPDCSVTDCGNWDPPAVSEKVYYCGNGELYQEEEFLKKYHPVVYCYNSSVKHDGRTFKTILCEDGNMYMRSPNEANTDAELPQGVNVFAPKAGSDKAYNCTETGDVCIERNPNVSLEQDSLTGCHPVIDCPEK